MSAADQLPREPAPGRLGARGPSDAASGTVISYMVGIGAFLAVFAIAIGYLGVISGPGVGPGELDLDSNAHNAITVLTGSPGVPTDWEDDPDTLQRLGLLKVGTEITMDDDKVRRLQPGDGNVGYDQGRESLGLEDRGVRVQAEPLFGGETNRSALQGYRLAYVGKYDSGTESTTSATESGTFDDTAVDYNDTLADGSELLGDPGDKFQDNATWVKAHLNPRLAGLRFNEDDGSLLLDETYWHINDTDAHGQNLRPDERFILTASLHDGVSWTYNDGEQDRIYIERLDLTGYDSNDPVWFNFSHHADGDGSFLDLDSDGGIVETRPVDESVSWDRESVGSFADNGTATEFVNATVDITEGRGDEVYLALRWDTDGDGTTGAGWFISNWTVEAVRDGLHVTLAENRLDYTRTTLDILVAGGGIEHGQLSHSAQTKSGIKEWIENGGDVYGLGPENPSSRTWLEPWIDQSEGEKDLTGDVDPDESMLTHSILRTPHALPYMDWPLTEHAWGVTDSEPFTQVLVRWDSDTDPQELFPALAVSTEDAPGDGNIVVSSLHATESSVSEDQRRDYFENGLLFLRHRGLYVDWGGTPPEGSPVGSAELVGLVDADGPGIDHPNFRVTVHVWP